MWPGWTESRLYFAFVWTEIALGTGLSVALLVSQL
jgi:hypothetical protein